MKTAPRALSEVPTATHLHRGCAACIAETAGSGRLSRYVHVENALRICCGIAGANLTPGTTRGHQGLRSDASYWINFASTADPNGPGLPHWRAFDERAETCRQNSGARASCGSFDTLWQFTNYSDFRREDDQAPAHSPARCRDRQVRAVLRIGITHETISPGFQVVIKSLQHSRRRPRPLPRHAPNKPPTRW